MKLLKALLHSLLRKRNRWLLYIPPGVPTGWDLQYDLKLVFPKEDPVILDVGANMGQSIQLFTSVFKFPVIHAFEPTPSCYNYIASQPWKSKVHVHQLAIGDTEGRVTLHEYEMSVLNSVLQIDEGMKDRWDNIAPQSCSEVPVKSLDTVAAELNISTIHILKTDTQGFDLHVLRGAEGLFEKSSIRVVIIELNHSKVYSGQADMLEILSFLKERGFMLVDLYEKFRKGAFIEWSTALFVRA